MLLDEDPATLIHHTIGNFNIAPDKHAVSRIHESLGHLKEAREYRLREAESVLKKLARHHSALTAQHADALSAHSSSAHAARMVEMDTQKFRVAKAASDAEVEGERLEGERDALRARLAELDAQGVEGDEASRAARRAAEDPLVLRLKVYRSLGIDVEPDDKGGYSKAVVRNSAKGDVHVINVDPKFSRYFYADYFWSSL